MKLKELSEAKALVLDTPEKIIQWLRDQFFFSPDVIRVHEDLTVDILNGKQVIFKETNIKDVMVKLPIKFGIVEGTFSLTGCKKLKTLEGCPKEITNDFYLTDCKSLESLHGGPEIVHGKYDAGGCAKLKNLKGAPDVLNFDFDLSECDSLESLEGCPSRIDGIFYLDSCKALKTLEGCPNMIGGGMCLDYCTSLTSLEFAPKIIKGDFTIEYSGIHSLNKVSDHIHQIYGSFGFSIGKRGITAGGLGLILITGITHLAFQNAPPVKNYAPPFKIINKYLGQPDKIFECQQELIEAGYEAYAEL